MISISEALLTLSEAAALLPGQPHPSTIWRYCRIGLRGIRLESIMVKHTRFTTRAALGGFVAATSEPVNVAMPAQEVVA